MERPSGEPMTCERPAASDDGDADILALFAAADDGGLKLLLERHGAAVRTAVGKHFWGRRALTTLELDDVMNAACMQVWQHRDDYRPDRGTLHGWLYMVALNAARLLVRSRQRWIGKTSGHDLGLVPAPPPGQPLRALPFLELLRECIAKLSPQQRRVLEADLAAGGLADAKSLAAELGTTVEVIYVARSNGRKALRRLLTERGGSPQNGWSFGADPTDDEERP